MRLFEIKNTIHYDNWRLPNEEEIRKELSLKKAKNYNEELGLSNKINCWDSWNNIQKAVKNGKVVRLPYEDYDNIERLSSASTLKGMRNMSLNYRSGPRDPFRIAKGFENDDRIPMAIIIDCGNGRLVLVAGNTRLGCAKICNIIPYPKVLIILGNVKEEINENINEFGLTYYGNCKNSFEDGDSLIPIFRDVSDFACVEEDSEQITKDEFMKLTSPLEKEFLNIIKKHKCYYSYNYDKKIAMLYDDNTDTHYFWSNDRLNESINNENTYQKIDKILNELMEITPNIPKPKIKINNQQGDTLGFCHWQYGMKDGKLFIAQNTEIQIQKRATVDDNTLRRILAHELAHSEDFLLNDKAKLEKYGYHTYKMMRKFYKDSGHGEGWFKVAKRFNEKYGDGFVTVTSDQDMILDDTNIRPFYVLIIEYNGKMGWQISLRLSLKQKVYLNRCANHQMSYDNKRLYLSNDPVLLKYGAPMIMYGGSAMPRTDEQREHLLKLWNNGNDILDKFKNINESFLNPATVGLAATMAITGAIGGYNHNKNQEPEITSISDPSTLSNAQLNKICKASLNRMPDSIKDLLPESEWNKVKFKYTDSNIGGEYDPNNPYTITINDGKVVDAVVWHEALHMIQMRFYPRILNGMMNFNFNSRKSGDENNKYMGLDNSNNAIKIANRLRSSGKTMKDLNVEAQAEIVTNYGIYKYMLDNEKDSDYIKQWQNGVNTFSPWVQDYKDSYWKNNMKPSNISLYDRIMNLLQKVF